MVELIIRAGHPGFFLALSVEIPLEELGPRRTLAENHAAFMLCGSRCVGGDESPLLRSVSSIDPAWLPPPPLDMPPVCLSFFVGVADHLVPLSDLASPGFTWDQHRVRWGLSYEAFWKEVALAAMKGALHVPQQVLVPAA
jgi:hypothetical protein